MFDRDTEISNLLEHNPPLTAIVQIDFENVEAAVRNLALSSEYKSSSWTALEPRGGEAGPKSLRSYSKRKAKDLPALICHLVPADNAFQWLISTSRISTSRSRRYSIHFIPSSPSHPSLWLIQLVPRGHSQQDEAIESLRGRTDVFYGKVYSPIVDPG